jgi:hypothetical protein
MLISGSVIFSHPRLLAFNGQLIDPRAIFLVPEVKLRQPLYFPFTQIW